MIRSCARGIAGYKRMYNNIIQFNYKNRHPINTGSDEHVTVIYNAYTDVISRGAGRGKEERMREVVGGINHATDIIYTCV